MSNLLAYSGLTTKVRAMESGLLTDADFEEIANLRSVSEVISYLASHPGYDELFQSVDVTMMHRGNLEKILVMSRYKDFAKMYNFSTIKQRKYLRLFFMKYEVALLKNVLSQIFEKKSVELDTSIIGAYFAQFSKIPLKEISGDMTVEQLMELLQGTLFYAPLKKVHEYGDATLFDYEMCLDVLQFTAVWKNKKKYLSGYDLKSVTEDYGYRIDMLNIQWIYRMKTYYRTSDADIYSLLIPIQYKLKKSEIKAMVEADQPSELDALIAQTYYGTLISRLSTDENLSMEGAYRKIMDRCHKKATKTNPYSLAIVDSYFYKKQREISRLITATECIRYSYPVDEILKMIS